MPMTLIGALLDRLLGAVDLMFDAVAALMRVLLRGAFRQDAASLRGERYFPLPKSSILLQEIELNAADEEQARRAVALDPDRHLPLAPDAALFAVAGPIESGAKLRTKPERKFLLGIVRKDALTRLRAELPPHRASITEAFAFAPSEYPGIAFSFTDEPGLRRRRFRRGVLALALAVFAVAAWDAAGAWQGALSASVAQIEAERLQAERRVRLAERSERNARAAAEGISQTPAPRLVDVQARLSRLGLNLPAHSELTAVELTPDSLIARGRSSAPAELELALRRTFEGETIMFLATQGETLQPFEARIALRPVSAPADQR